jgi:hypothetical protein
MNAQMKEPPRAANLSRTLTGFEIPKRFKNLLVQFDKMHAYMKLAKKAPPCVRLKRQDFNDLNAIVRAQSQGQRTLGQLTYRDLPILSAGE